MGKGLALFYISFGISFMILFFSGLHLEAFLTFLVIAGITWSLKLCGIPTA